MRELKKRLRFLQNLGLVKWEKKEFVDIKIIDLIFFELRDEAKKIEMGEMERLNELDKKITEMFEKEATKDDEEELNLIEKILAEKVKY